MIEAICFEKEHDYIASDRDGWQVCRKCGLMRQTRAVEHRNGADLDGTQAACVHEYDPLVLGYFCIKCERYGTTPLS